MMYRTKSALRSLYSFASRHPLRTGLVVAGVFMVAGLPWFFVPKTVAFSYAGDNCIKEVTLLPQLHGQHGDGRYIVSYEDIQTVGGVPIWSAMACFTPRQAPQPGGVEIATSPWSSGIFTQRYRLVVGPEPQVDVSALTQAVPVTKPLTLALDKPDTLHSYQLVVDKKSTECLSDGNTTIHCDLGGLGLSQGQQYNYRLTKQFSSQAVEPISQGTLETLRAVKVVKSDIRQGQIVYAKPSKFRLTLDKSIASASASLRSGHAAVPVKVSTKGRVVSVALTKPLQRSADYRLALETVEATDGSTLVEPYTVSFTMSGGPKVTGVSVGSSRVEPNAQLVLTFDQELSTKQDLAALVSFKGGKATVSKTGPRQVTVQLNNLGRCVPFTVSVKAGVLSKYGIKNKKAWSYDSRTICYTTSVYGTSLQGRPLVAYRFGNSGPVTLYTGAIHGNEVSSMYMMQSWIAELEANPDKIGKRQIVIIPSINPDGVAAGTRNNSRDVNLSRNFPTSNWERDIDDTDGPNKGGGGKQPLSEPAAAALARFTQNLRPRLLVSYHAVGSLVVGDGHGTYSGGKAAQYVRMVGYRNATGDGGTFDYAITGSYEDWTWRNVGIPSLVIELGSYSYHNFAHHRAALWAMLE